MPNKLNQSDVKLEWIPLKNLSVVWVRSQRTLNPKWANEIASNFDLDLLEAIVVTLPNGAGEYHIVDGQHRKAALEKWLGDSNQKVLCRILEHSSPAKAAEVWLGLSKGRKPIRPVVEFLVAVEAKRDVEVAINNIVKRQGYRVAEGSKQQDTIVAVGALRKVYSLSEKTLTYTLQACRLLWGSDPKGVGTILLQGMGIFVNEFHAHIDYLHLKKAVLKRYPSPHRLFTAAQDRKEDVGKDETLPIAVSELVRRAYNWNRKNGVLEHKE